MSGRAYPRTDPTNLPCQEVSIVRGTFSLGHIHMLVGHFLYYHRPILFNKSRGRLSQRLLKVFYICVRGTGQSSVGPRVFLRKILWREIQLCRRSGFSLNSRFTLTAFKPSWAWV